MSVSGFDHVALPAENPEALIAFYGALGFRVPDLEQWRRARVPFFSVHFGANKINFHAPELWRERGFDLRGPTALPGCGDLCFVWSGASQDLAERLAAAGAEIEEGPVERDGARGTGTSVYVRDPDRNLVEFIIYPEVRETPVD